MINQNALDIINSSDGILKLLQDEYGISKDKKGFICPSCGHGKGGDGVTRKKNHAGFKCFACEKVDTSLNWLRQSPRYSSVEFPLFAKDVAGQLGIQLEYDNTGNTAIKEAIPTKQQTPATKEEKPKTDFTRYYNECKQDIEPAYRYMQSRGISRKTCEANHVYYDKKAEAVVLAATKSCCLLRATGEYIRGWDKKKAFKKDSKAYTWGLWHLKGEIDKPVFIVEGAIDALSIIEVGGLAIGLQSVVFKQSFLKWFEANKAKFNMRSHFILALDNDAAGRKANEELKTALDEKGISCFIYSKLSGEYKDPNERLVHDREGLSREVNRTAEEWNKLSLFADSNLGCLDDIFNVYRAQKQVYKTGFDNLDDVLGGGLYRGLYFIGAISSLGKTTFILQIADQLAAAGHHVIYISLEMSKAELVAKSLSRISEENYLKRQKPAQIKALTTRDILSRYNSIQGDSDSPAFNALSEATGRYKEFAGNLFVYARVGDIGITEIESLVRNHIKKTGMKPVVMIDYLQIMKPIADPAIKTDKQQIDQAVKRLKLLAENNDVPILAISSFNRMNYNEPVNMASFKESGAVEYTSDVLIGLQYEFMNFKQNGDSWEKEGERTKRLHTDMKNANRLSERGEPILVECKILKNRNGRKESCYFNTYMKYNRYEPAEKHFTDNKSNELSEAEAAFCSRWDKNGKPIRGKDLLKQTYADHAGRKWKGIKKGVAYYMEAQDGDRQIILADDWLKAEREAEQAAKAEPAKQEARQPVTPHDIPDNEPF